MGWEIKKKQKQENDKCLREGNRFRQNFNLYLLRAAYKMRFAKPYIKSTQGNLNIISCPLYTG